MRSHLGALVMLLAVLPGVAGAAPTLSLVWSGTTGTGATGGSTIFIEPGAGETLTLDVVVTIDGDGFFGAAWDLLYSSGLGSLTASLGSMPGTGGPAECPAPPNPVPGTCFSSDFTAFGPLSPGIVEVPGAITGYDVVGLNASTFAPGTIVVGRAVFVMNGFFETVQTSFAPGVGGIIDGSFAFSVPSVATAWAIEPEPATGALLGFGLVLLARVARRAA